MDRLATIAGWVLVVPAGVLALVLGFAVVGDALYRAAVVARFREQLRRL